MNTYHVEQEFQGGYTAKRTSTRYIVVHHAAALYATRNGIDDVRTVARYHTLTNGWPGIGYHEVLAEEVEGGPIGLYVCSDLNLQRAHVAWRNESAVGISMLTNIERHPGKLPLTKWFDALVQGVADLKRRYPQAQIVGHKEIAFNAHTSPDGKDWSTTCPGVRWFDWKGDLIHAVEKLLNPPVTPATPQQLVVRPNCLALVREGPGRQYPIALGSNPELQQALAILEPGQPFTARVILTGQAVGGENRWAWDVNQLGFCHLSALEATGKV